MDDPDDPSICGCTDIAARNGEQLNGSGSGNKSKVGSNYTDKRQIQQNVNKYQDAQYSANSLIPTTGLSEKDIVDAVSHNNGGDWKSSLRAHYTSIVKILIILVAQLPVYASGMPVSGKLSGKVTHQSAGGEVSSTTAHTTNAAPELNRDFWINISISTFLVLLGGVFAGLTLGLMGQDEVYLQVMKVSGTPSERKNASKVLSLLGRGKHWVLVTLLLSNVITNETLPIVLDRSLGGGWPAVASSTVAIVVFGEIIPQSVSVRYGLAVGATFAPFVLLLMYLMYPVAYPIANLLDHILGEDHGTVYKKSGLKTLVTLHKNMGVERLNQDEVTIISAVLDLKEKPVGTIMTPMEDVFVLSSDTILDEKTMEQILHTGFNRIPIHVPGEPDNFIGMLLVRILITYDPEDALPISSFPLATLPETGPETSCLNILNYFQEGRSHMVIVSESPGEPYGALGVLTLEDVIEELIGEEIVDESDVYVDVAKAIRRAQPGPLSKRLVAAVGGSPKSSPRPSLSDFAATAQHIQHQLMHHKHSGSIGGSTTGIASTNNSSAAIGARRSSLSKRNSFDHDPPSATSPLLETPHSGDANNSVQDIPLPRLGPSNKASNPLQTTVPNVTIKRTKTFDTDPNNSTSAITKPLDGSEVMGKQPQKNGGQIFASEHAAIREATAQALNEDVRPIEVDQRNNSDDNQSEVRSFKGGIVESVVNVQGINKVIIEDVFGDGRHSSNEDIPNSDRSKHGRFSSRAASSSSSSKKRQDSSGSDSSDSGRPLIPH